MKKTHNASQDQGFTLIELLVIIAVIAMLVVMLQPALAKAKPKAMGITCLNNQKQLALAAILYAKNNQDNWVPNFPGQTPEWVSGRMSWNVSNTDITNAAKLVNPAVSVMAPYVVNANVFHCPADTTYMTEEGSRVRSVSMNQAVGTVGQTVGPLTAGSAVNGQWLLGQNIGTSRQTSWRTYGKTSSMVAPTPAMLWIFLDEHPNSIDDAGFAVQMAMTGRFASIIDVPASYHNGAGSFSFADGHSELHKWIGKTIQFPIVNGGARIGGGMNGIDAGDSWADVVWIQQRTSAHM